MGGCHRLLGRPSIWTRSTKLAVGGVCRRIHRLYLDLLHPLRTLPRALGQSPAREDHEPATDYGARKDLFKVRFGAHLNVAVVLARCRIQLGW